MNLLLCMQFIALFGGSYAQEMSNNCSLTLEGHTWQFDPENDVAIPGISSNDDCAEECLSLDWCVGYTWSLDDSAGSMCYLFHQLNGLHPCNNCSECISGKFNQMTGVCNPDDAEDIIAVEDADTELACVEHCAATPGCNYYSWSNGTIFTNKCFLFKECCNPVDSCESFQSGEMACFVQDIQDGPCNNYKVLNDRNRNVQNNFQPQKCDRSSHTNVSPDWQGHAWYRILPPAGTHIPTQSPGSAKCGTSASGWINGFPAISQIGQTEKATVCYHNGNNACFQKNEINITLCTDVETKYYVYQLPDMLNCHYKYCAK